MSELLGKKGIDTAYEESLLPSEPTFRRIPPISHATEGENEGIQAFERAEDFSLTNTLLGYDEVVKIATEYQGFVLKRLENTEIIQAESQIEGWLLAKGQVLSAEGWLYGLLEIIRGRAEIANQELKEQFLIGENLTMAEIEQGEAKSIQNWKALLGIVEQEGHPREEPEIDTKELASVSGLHRQIADLGVIHINRVEDMLEILELVEQECVSPEATIRDGISYLATFLESISSTAALAQVKAVQQKRINELLQLLKGGTQVNLERIKALHESQDQSFRMRNSYEANILNPLMEMTDGVSQAMDSFADILMESAEDASIASGQGQAALLQVFKSEREWLGRMFAKAVDLADTAHFVHILADLSINQASDAQEIESRLLNWSESS